MRTFSIMAKSFKKEYKTLHAIFSEIASAKTKQERVEILCQHNFLHVRDVLRGAFDDSIQWDLPEGTPPFEEFEVAANEGSNGGLSKVTKQLTYLVENSLKGKNVSPLKKEKMWVNILEAIHPDDTVVFTAMKDKKLGNSMYRGLTKAVVQEAFPNLIRV